MEDKPNTCYDCLYFFDTACTDALDDGSVCKEFYPRDDELWKEPN